MKRARRRHASANHPSHPRRSAPKRAGATRAGRGRGRLGPTASDLVIVSRALTDLADFLQERQESAGRGRVILDRRVGERRRSAHAVDDERRRSDRRHPDVDPTQALMRVLGFTVAPSGVPPARPAPRAGAGASTTRGSRRAAPPGRTATRRPRA
jgi:hypothetical protein